MDQAIYLITLVGTTLVLVAAFTSLIAFRFGAPLLLVFLAIGLIAGVDGLGIDFDNAPLAYFVGSLALAIILFDSGFSTNPRSLKQAALPAVSLATIGVMLTAAIQAVAAHFVLGLDWIEALLLGAIVGSTDAAAVFFLLRTGNVNIRDRVRSTLEIESSSNDPIAVFLTLTLVQVVSAGEMINPGELAGTIALGFLKAMGIGIFIGVVGGWLISRLVERLSLEGGLQPIFVIALSLLVFAIAGALDGSGLLAVYIAGIVAGTQLKNRTQIKKFQEGMTWLAQIIMFLVLGLFATPSQFPVIIIPAIVLGLFLIFVARPLAVALCLAPFRYQRAETSFVSWVGLRGAVSILLAITPLIDRLEHGLLLFNTAFIIVVTSLLVQGWTVLPLARRLKLVIPAHRGPLAKHEVDLPGKASHELLVYRVSPDSPVGRGRPVPRWARPALVIRGEKSMNYQYARGLKSGDQVYIFVPRNDAKLLDRLFASPAEVAPDDADFFGAFEIDPARPLSELENAYGAETPSSNDDTPIGEWMRERLGGSAEVADRLAHGEIELIVREINDDGSIAAIGLSVEPQTVVPRVPTFMSLGEMADRAKQIWHAWRQRSKNAAPSSKNVMDAQHGTPKNEQTERQDSSS